MAIALTLKQYLDDHDIDYDVMVHDRTSTSWQSAKACQVPADSLAKAVVLSREGGFLIAVVPADCKVQLDAVSALLPGGVAMASEDEIGELFPDCEPGAMPALASAYGMDVVVDRSLDDRSDIYFEGGDHQALVHVRGSQFRDLTGDSPHAQIAERTRS